MGARSPARLARKVASGGLDLDRPVHSGQRFAAGRADPITANQIGRPGLNAGQQRAWTACCSPGLHLVWGPPGTGKTKVIAQALQDLIASGKSVLLVSMTNIAVDNALAKAATIGPAPGVMIRAGTPHLTDIAQNSAICLQKLIDERQKELEQERRRLEEQISTLSADPAVVGLARVDTELEGFDMGVYRAAEVRLARAGALAAREAELAQVRRQETGAALELANLDDRFRMVHMEYTAAETARQYIADATGCQRTQDDLKLAMGNAVTAISKLEDERDRLLRSSPQPGNGAGLGTVT